MDYEEAKKKVVDELMRKMKTKSKWYFNDLSEIIGEKPRESKKLITKMIEEGILEFWSSGSTSMYGLKGQGKQASAEGES